MADNTEKAVESALPPPGGQEGAMDAGHHNMEAVSVSEPTKSSDIDTIMKSLDMDPYNEDEAELRFLHSKPTCFIIIGKPGVGKTTMARRLAQEWKCELVNSTDLIKQNIELQTEMGLKCLEILTRGEAIPEDVVFKMIDDKVNSPECTHHGYVMDDFPSLSEDYMTIRDQLDLIRNWKLRPDFIINLKIPDGDIIRRRLGFKIDPITGEIYTKEMYAPEKPLKLSEDKEGEEEEEGEEEAEEEEMENEEEEATAEVPVDVLERLIRRPEDMDEQVDEIISKYKDNMLRRLEDYMADHDQQYLVEMDGNLNSFMLFKQLIQRLNCFVLRPAAVPMRLYDPEEDDINEEIQTDELMRQMSAKHMVAPRFRWRRSRWARSCPVSLFEGNIVNGKPEFAVSFLDKMYFLSDGEAMEKFLKNPRPYLLPPQPRPTAKFSILGPPLSGKTTLCHLLAQKYGAKVLNMEELIKPRLSEEKDRMLKQVRDEMTESAIITVKAKIKEQMDAEAEAAAAAREAAELAEQEAEEQREGGDDDDEDKEDKSTKDGESGRASAANEKDVDGEKEIGEPGEKSDPQNETDEGENQEGVKTPEGGTVDLHGEKGELDESTKGTEEKGDKPAGETEEATATAAQEEKPAVPEVDATHPDVVTIVEAAVKDAEKNAVQLSAEAYIDVLEAAIKETERELRKKFPDGPINGGWVLDNFPSTRDQWNVCVEKGILPDDVIILNDSSENGQFLNMRYYMLNREDIDAKISVRAEKEEIERQRKLEEKRKRDEEERLRREEVARIAAEEERQRRLEEGEELLEGAENDNAEGEDKESDVGDKPKDEEEKSEEPSPNQTLDTSAAQNEKQTDQKDESDEKEKEEEYNPLEKEETKVPEGPELDVYKKLRQEYDKEFVSVHGTITGSTSIEPIVVDIEGKSIEEMWQCAVDYVEKQLSYFGWEYSGIDVDEEEEDNEADAGEEEEEVEEEEEDPNRNKKKPLGDTNHFCPVALKDTGVLFPGNPEIAAKYRERVYYFSSNDARESFLNNSEVYLPQKKPLEPPPVRILILGPRGAGKSLHGRQLAKKFGVFHIQFKERLQELIIHKTKKKIGPEFEEENEEEEVEEEEEEDAAITGPDSSAASDEKSAEADKEGEQTDSKTAQDEEEEGEELTEEEEAIKSNLESDEALPADVLDKIVPQWWQKEPFKSTGFILEGFPRTPDEVKYLAELGLFPDACIILTVSDSDVIGRLLPPKLDKWRIRRDKMLAKKQKKMEKAKKKRDATIQKRREELLKDQEEKRKERQAQKAAEREEYDDEEEEDMGEEEEEEEEDIEAILAEEFEEEEEEDEEEEELEEDAIDRMRNNLNEMYDNDTNRLEAVQDMLEEILIPRLEIDGNRKPHIVKYILTKKIKPFVEFRHSLFERVYSISEKLAKKMLSLGYKQPSRFGRWCPVELHNGECIQPMSGPGFSTYPCVYRQHIYFLSSLQARDQFIHDPMTYLKQKSPKPVVPIRLAIIGPPKSGKTSLANRFVEEYGLVRLSIGEAMRMILQNQPHSDLVKKMNSHLSKGLTVPDELAVQALEVCMLDMRCQTRGFVLDGFPTSRKQIDLLTERSLIPVRVIELELESKDVLVRGTKDRVAPTRAGAVLWNGLPDEVRQCHDVHSFRSTLKTILFKQAILPIHDSSQILTIRLQAFRHSVGEVREWYENEHMNYVKINGNSSKWALWHNVVDVSKNSVQQIQTYLQRISDGLSASVANMCITPTEFEQRLGDFGQYCPVSLALRGELVDCSTEPSLKYAAEYRGHYYKMASQTELDQFLENPEKFVPPLAPRKLPPPELLPKRRKPEEVQAIKDIELQGYCPVTFLDGKSRYEAIIPGNPELIVEYMEKFYYFETEEKLLKFMKLPETYSALRLPHKLPPRKQPLPVTGLPMLGFMEQTVSSAIIKALTAAGNFKPKYPFLSTSRSSLLYVAYHLKAYNPNSSDYVRKKYKQKLQRFEETCRLIQYLGDNMTVRYRAPAERPQDFDFKLETFFALRGIEPTPTWIA